MGVGPNLEKVSMRISHSFQQSCKECVTFIRAA